MQGNPGAGCGGYTRRPRDAQGQPGAAQPKSQETIPESSEDGSPNSADARCRHRTEMGVFSGVEQVEEKCTLQPQIGKLFLKTALSFGSCQETPSFFSRDCSDLCTQLQQPKHFRGKTLHGHKAGVKEACVCDFGTFLSKHTSVRALKLLFAPCLVHTQRSLLGYIFCKKNRVSQLRTQSVVLNLSPTPTKPS